MSFLSVIVMDSVLSFGGSKKCKYVIKGKKIPKYIINDIQIYSDSDKEHFDEKKSDEENPKNTNITNKDFFTKFFSIYKYGK